ncbi:hypothetical protein N7466_006602 [Penicillium verhagenii]|uniref:uncharacterized protein n=1 Tax=Penicillium verhagenii TaxID=1562060 RepID=UPI00254527EB|nr:uncharacterized protein N7466_006602 [Penicillium verhagenii]KAJ5931109.1 hypothetical protein N7466_006602 [Penicillium verhagenii]
MRFSTTLARPLQLILRSLQWISAVVVLGLTSRFINQGPHGQHITYQEVISALSIVFFIPAFISPFRPAFLSKVVIPIDLVFSYLWLTAFVFAAQDYNWHSCYFHSPPGVTCQRKRANEAFIFLAFIFTFLGIPLEGAALHAYRRNRVIQPVVEKHDGAGATTGTGTRAPLDAPAEVAAPVATV